MSNYTLLLIDLFSVDIPYDQYDGDDISKIKNNTIIGEQGYDFDEDILRQMLSKNLINLPGATPMNTQIDDD